MRLVSTYRHFNRTPDTRDGLMNFNQGVYHELEVLIYRQSYFLPEDPETNVHNVLSFFSIPQTQQNMNIARRKLLDDRFFVIFLIYL